MDEECASIKKKMTNIIKVQNAFVKEKHAFSALSLEHT